MKKIWSNIPAIDRKYHRVMCKRYLANRRARKIPIDSYYRITDFIDPTITFKPDIKKEDLPYLGIYRSHLIGLIDAEIIFLNARTDETPNEPVGWNSVESVRHLSKMEEELGNLSMLIFKNR